MAGHPGVAFGLGRGSSKLEVADRAQQLLDRYGLSYWDAMIVAACLAAALAGIDSEDFSGHKRIDGLEVVNPFLSEP